MEKVEVSVEILLFADILVGGKYKKICRHYFVCGRFFCILNIYCIVNLLY